jgi:hypothetical protein
MRIVYVSWAVEDTKGVFNDPMEWTRSAYNQAWVDNLAGLCEPTKLRTLRLMKKQNLFVILLALLLLTTGTSACPIKLKRFTVVNKSMVPIELKLVGECIEDNEYYLRVAEGDKAAPTTTVFTVLPDIYTVTVYFDELWDPVYGTVCGGKSEKIDLNHNARLVVGICTYTPTQKSDAPFYKLGAPRGGRASTRR